MKKLLLLSLNLFGLVCAAIATSNTSDETHKEIHESVNVNSNVRMLLHTGFTNVRVETWSQNTVDITVRITTDARTEQRAQEMLEKVSVNIEKSSAMVELSIDLGNSNCKNNEEFDITAEIKMPAGGSLEGDISFGNLDLTSLNGPCKLVIEYGNVHAGNLRSKDNNLKAAFGNADVETFGGGILYCEYGNIHLGILNNSCTITSQFGNLDINTVESTCESVSVDAEYGDIHMGLASTAGFTFDTNAEYGTVHLPANVKMNTSKKDYTSERFTGTIGSGSCSLKAAVEFGNITITK